MLKPPGDRKVTGGVSALTPDPTFQRKFPILWEYLTKTTFDDGTPRDTSSVLVFLDAGTWKLMLRDKTAGLCLWVAAKTPTVVWEALEAALGDPSTEWRVDRQQAGQTAKRVKRTP